MRLFSLSLSLNFSFAEKIFPHARVPLSGHNSVHRVSQLISRCLATAQTQLRKYVNDFAMVSCEISLSIWRTSCQCERLPRWSLVRLAAPGAAVPSRRKAATGRSTVAGTAVLCGCGTRFVASVRVEDGAVLAGASRPRATQWSPESDAQVIVGAGEHRARCDRGVPGDPARGVAMWKPTDLHNLLNWQKHIFVSSEWSSLIFGVECCKGLQYSSQWWAEGSPKKGRTQLSKKKSQDEVLYA